MARIASATNHAIPYRSLQRYVAQLVKEGSVMREGRGRATIYRLAESAAPITETPPRGDRREYLSYIPVSEAGLEILAYVQQAKGARKPTGFDRRFLEYYQPNSTHYLPKNLRWRLRNIGEIEKTPLPAGTYGRLVLDRLLIDLSWASSQLEGNTYSRLETERLVAAGIEAEGKNAQETQMILNHKRAVEMLVEQAEELGFNRYTILNLHGMLSDNLLSDPSASGQLRGRPVQISGSTYLPTEVPQTIEEMFDKFLHKADAIADPYEQAFFALVHLPYLQPFEDVNKRVARMAANIPFVKQNLCPLTFLDVPTQAYLDGTLGVYELQRVELLADVFAWAYERSAQAYVQVKKTLAEPEPIRLRYRTQIYAAIHEVVVGGFTSYTAVVRDFSASIPSEDREDFVETTLEEVKRLHEGVIARYRIRPSQYEAWRRAIESNS